MNLSNFDYNLIKHLDLINFWEPFQRKHPSLRIGIRALISDLREKSRLVRNAREVIEGVELPKFSKPFLISYNTLNQKAALYRICNRLAGQYDLMSESPEFSSHILPEEYLYERALEYKVTMLLNFITFRGYDKTAFRSRYYNFYKQLGFYAHYKDAMKDGKSNIKLYIGSNDHSGLSQIGFVAARNLNIPSLYIQHAAVSDLFPPLTCTYAFLDGEDAREKYLKAGKTDTKIELIGPTKFDPYLQKLNSQDTGDLVGVCLGLENCDLDENFKLCQLLEQANIPFCLRFHPRMPESPQRRFRDAGWCFSIPKKEDALDFVLRCHTIVSPDSSIHLEATILKRRSIYFAPKDGAIDYYGFVKNGVIDSAIHKASVVIKKLNQSTSLENYRINARHYHAGLYTDWEGYSTDKVLEKIQAMT